MSYSGTGDYTVNGVQLRAGDAASGTLTISGGTYGVSSLSSGWNSSASPSLVTGILTLTGGTTEVTATAGASAIASVVVGATEASAAPTAQGDGTLNILNGASLTAGNSAYWSGSSTVGGYRNVVIGEGAGNYGTVNVDGAGSSLVASGDSARIIVGSKGGTGTLNVTNGGYVGTLSLRVGLDSGSTGQLNINGGTVKLGNMSGTYLDPLYAGFAALADFGRNGGSGYLDLRGGGTLTVENTDGLTDSPIVRFGRNDGDYGYGVITGTGTSLNVIQHGATGDSYDGGSRLLVGRQGQGVVKVENGAAVNVTGDDARMFVAVGSFGSTPTGTTAESRLEIRGGGVVTVDSGTYGGTPYTGAGGYRGSQVAVASGANTNGRIIVDGAGSELNVLSSSDVANDDVTGQLLLGQLGTGILEVSNGAAVNVRELEVGVFADGYDGGGNRTASGGYLQTVLYAGSGTVNISGGGTVTVAGTANAAYRGVQLGRATGTSGTINVDGAGSELVSTGGAGMVRIGNYGTGELSLTNGGTAKAFFLEAGRNAGGNGYVSIDGYGSRVVLSDDYGAWPSFAGEAAFARFGRNDGSYGRLDITNGGEFDLSNGSSTSDLPIFELGREFGATGRATIDGSDGLGHFSTLNVTLTGPSTDAYNPTPGRYYGPEIRIGRYGEGKMYVTNGGVVNLTGEAAQLIVSRGGNNPTASTEQSELHILSGSTVNVSSVGNEYGAAVVVGDRLTGNGKLVISGAGSELNITTDNVDNFQANNGGEIAFGAALVVGGYGTGDLALTGGADVSINGANDSFPAFIVGRGHEYGGAAANGTALIAGAGTTLTIQGTSTPATGGSVFGEGGNISVALYSGASGTLTIASGAVVSNSSVNSFTQVAGVQGAQGTLNVLGSGTVLNAGLKLHVGSDIDIATGVSLPSYGGDGTLTLGAGATINTGTAVIGDTGIFNASGTLNGDLELHGVMNVGGAGSVGTFNHSGQIGFLTGTMVVDVHDFAPGQADLIVTDDSIVPADVEFAELEVTLAAGARFGIGDSQTILQTTGTVDLLATTLTASDGTEFVVDDAGGNSVVLTALQAREDGTAGDDTMTGAGLTDTLFGGSGNDTLRGLDGSDLLYGGDGSDTADYSGSNAAVTVSLAGGVALGGHAEGDQFSGIENLIGSGFNDVLFGNGGSNTIDGGAGGDVLSGEGGSDVLYGGAGFDALSGADGGAGAADTLFGGADLDIAYYFTASSAQVVDFNDHTNLATNSGEHTLDTWDSIEGFYGASNFSNTITGDAQDNLFLGGNQADVLYGGGGSDILIGRGGADLIYGGAGNDFISGDGGTDDLYGDAGEDTFYIFASSGVDRLKDFSITDDSLLFFQTGATQWSDLTRSQVGNDVHVTLSGGSFTVIVENVTVGDLDGASGGFSFF